MKKRPGFYLKVLGGILLISLVVYACSQEQEMAQPQQPVEPLTITNAQEWYNLNFGFTPQAKSQSGDSDFELTPQWNDADLSDNPVWYTVESPLESSSDTRFLFMKAEVAQHAQEQNSYSDVKQIYRHVVMRNKETGDTYAFMMVVIPTLDYMLRVGEDIESNKYLSRESDLDGDILYYTCAGEFVNGWVYENGRILAGTHVEEFGGNRKKIWVNIERCWTRQALGGLPGALAVLDEWVECREYSTWIDDSPLQHLQQNFDMDGGGGAYLPPLGGGGGGGNPSPPANQEKKPDGRTDCAGKATENASNAKGAMDANAATKKAIADLTAKSQNGTRQEYGSRIDYKNGVYSSIDVIDGGAITIGIPMNHPYTVYDIHTHPYANASLPGLNSFSPSCADISALLTQYGHSQAMGGNYKGSIIIAADGTQYLISVNDPSQANTQATRDQFALSKDRHLFAKKEMNDDYNEISGDLKAKGFSMSEADLYALSFVLDKYKSGLKVSKKEKGKTAFKETKTNEKSSKNYQPTICP